MNNLDKALALVNYVQHIQDNCLFREKQTSNLNFSSISLADKEKIGLSNLMDGVLVEPFQQLADFILVNLTNKAIINKNLNCSFIFADPLCKIIFLFHLFIIILKVQNRSSLCSLAQVNINNLDSNLLWVNAYLDQTTSQAWNYLLSVTNLNEVHF